MDDARSRPVRTGRTRSLADRRCCSAPPSARARTHAPRHAPNRPQPRRGRTVHDSAGTASTTPGTQNHRAMNRGLLAARLAAALGTAAVLLDPDRHRRGRGRLRRPSRPSATGRYLPSAARGAADVVRAFERTARALGGRSPRGRPALHPRRRGGLPRRRRRHLRGRRRRSARGDGDRRRGAPVERRTAGARRRGRRRSSRPERSSARSPSRAPTARRAACLHWGVRVGDDYVDPLSLLAGRGTGRSCSRSSTRRH